jgi:hypothetical protein
LEQLGGGSLLAVDVSGVDASRINSSPAPTESLIDALNFRPPTGFSMRDDEAGSTKTSPPASQPARVAASAAHNKSVSLHEGFAPRPSSANHAATLDDSQSSSSDRLRVSVPSAPQFTLSDRNSVQNRFTDKAAGQDAIHESLSDKSDSSQKPAKESTDKVAVAKSFSDQQPILTARPPEFPVGNDKTSRASAPVELVPPTRLAKNTPPALPLDSALPIASTVAPQPLLPPPAKALPVAESKTDAVAAKTPTNKPISLPAPALADKPTESLIDGLMPLALPASPTTKEQSLSETASSVAAVKPEAKPENTLPASPTTRSNVPAKPATPTVVKVEEPKRPEKFTLSDINPIALQRPLIKAANAPMALSEEENEAAVVQTSHEVDETASQLVKYSKLAAKMQQAVKQKFPSSRVKVTSNEDGLIVEGHVANDSEASKVLSFIRKSSLCPVADRVTTKQ